MFQITYQEEIEIDVPAQQAWDTLSDFEAYPKWHPFTPQVQLEPKVGARIKQDVIMFPERSPFKFRGVISGWVPGTSMSWKMNYKCGPNEFNSFNRFRKTDAVILQPT